MQSVIVISKIAGGEAKTIISFVFDTEAYARASFEDINTKRPESDKGELYLVDLYIGDDLEGELDFTGAQVIWASGYLASEVLDNHTGGDPA